jgi:hypothetical protein
LLWNGLRWHGCGSVEERDPPDVEARIEDGGDHVLVGAFTASGVTHGGRDVAG